MDESAAAANRDEGADNKYGSEDSTCEITVDPPTEDSADTEEYSVTCQDCGQMFTHMDAYNTHLHQHALEEEEAPMGDSRTPAAGLASGIMDAADSGPEGASGGADGCDVSGSAETEPSMKNALPKVYACLVCGKVYSYLVSFEKHQRLHEREIPAVKSPIQSDQNLRKYECPDCGMSFIRKTRLLSHLLVHKTRRRYKTTPAKCDQCNKYFTSAKSWLHHLDLHNQRRFWCLSCAQGFLDEVSLDKHLQKHSLRRPKKNSHPSTHASAKPHPKKLVAHESEHFTGHLGMSGTLPGSLAFDVKEEDIKNSALLTSVNDDDDDEDDDPEMKTALPKMEELPVKEESMHTGEDQSPEEDSECGGDENSEESDCGEPVHCFPVSKVTGSADPSDKTKSEGELDEKEPNQHREHKYWEWECIECDMGFDEMAKLHLHYIQHATGEVPIPQDDTEG